jgi:lysine/ornithine N-monooxygenase
MERSQLKKKRDSFIARLNSIHEDHLNKSGVRLIRGRAKFSNKNTLVVDDVQYTADNIIIATGTRPIIPKNIEGSQLGHTSDAFFEFTSLPRKTLVVGAGCLFFLYRVGSGVMNFFFKVMWGSRSQGFYNLLVLLLPFLYGTIKCCEYSTKLLGVSY